MKGPFSNVSGPGDTHCTEPKFLDVIGTKVLRVFLLAIHSHLYLRILPFPPLSKSGLKLVCNVNIVYGNLKSEKSQDDAQKPQRNCTFMNSASVLETLNGLPQEVGMVCTLLNSIMEPVMPSFNND